MEWSTDKINDWVNDRKQFERDQKIKVILDEENYEIFEKPLVNGFRSDITFKYTQNEIEEFINLTKNPLIINNYQGNKLRDYQKEMLNDINNNNFSILNTSRQIGTNVVTAHHTLYYILSNYNKDVVYLCTNDDSCEKFFRCFLDLLFELPYHLQVGIKSIIYDEKLVKMSNGSRLMVKNNIESTLGNSMDYLILPEFAFNNEDEKIFTTLLHILRSRKNSRILIYSCPNKKDDYFKKMFLGDEFNYFKKTYPYTIMNLPSAETFEKTQTMLIGEDSFIKEYECIFPGTPEFRDRRIGIIFN